MVDPNNKVYDVIHHWYGGESNNSRILNNSPSLPYL